MDKPQKINFLKSTLRNCKARECRESFLDLTFGCEGGGVSLEEAIKSDKRYITGFITIQEEHSLPLTVRFFVAGQEERCYIRFVILPGVRTRVCFDLRWVGMEEGVRRTPGTLKQVIHGSRTDRRTLEKVELGVKEVFHEVHLIFEEFVLADEKPTDFPLPDIKLVDRFGQYLPKEWPGKIHDEEELQAAFEKNRGPKAYPFMYWNRWGGDTRRKLKEGTGFFSTCKTEDGRWHLTDPEGYDYFSMGVCCARPRNPGDVTGMKKMLEYLPEPEEALYRFYQEGMHPWYPERLEQFDFMGANLYRVYGEDWEEKGKEISYHILSENGINTQGNGLGMDIGNGRTKIPYVREIPGFPRTKEAVFSDFPDVLSEEYRHNSVVYAEQLRGWKQDSWMIGYFMRNEPGFNFRPGVAIANEVLHDSKDTCCKKGLIDFLRERYQSVERLNQSWDSVFDSFEALRTPMEDCMREYPKSERDIREYSRFLVREYCRIPSQACRLVDPNHLNLGLRWSQMKNPDMLAGWEYMDVFSFNCYSFEPLRDMDFVRDAGVDRPILVGEFHCGALDRGLLSTGLKGVANQEQRGVMWRSFMEKCAVHPYGVGAHWFQYADEFVLGRFDGENYQIGLVDICMQPYRELTDAIKETASIIYEVKNGIIAPYEKEPEVIPMIG